MQIQLNNNYLNNKRDLWVCIFLLFGIKANSKCQVEKIYFSDIMRDFRYFSFILLFAGIDL